MPKSHPGGPRALAVIAAFKFLKSGSLFVLAILLSHLREPEATAHFVGWLHALPIAAGHEFIGRAIQSVSGLSPHAIGLIELVAIGYAALYAVEGYGLWRHARWAEYLTIVATSTFVPFEIWELWVRFTPMKLFAFAINVSIVAYLVWLLRREHAVREGFAPSKLQSRSQSPSSSPSSSS
jgi:uncharacterized membrane protein (DUF2068 family)